MKTWIRWVLTIMISAVAVAYAFRDIDVLKTFQTIVAAGHGRVWIWVPGGLLLDFCLRTERWRLLMVPLARKPWWRYFPITCGGFFLNNVLPFRAGEAARVFWTYRLTGHPFSRCLAVLATDRVFDMVALLSLMMVVSVSGVAAGDMSHWSVASLAGVSGVLLTILLVMAWHPEGVKRWSARPGLPPFLARTLHQFVDGAAALRDPWRMVRVVVVSLLFWGIEITVFWRVAQLFDVSIPWMAAGLVVVGMAFGAAVPSAPGYVGTLEAAGVGALSLLAFDRATALPLILAVHLGQIGTSILLGIPSLAILGRPREAAEPNR